MLWTSSVKYTPTFKGGTFIRDAVVQCLSLSLDKAWTQVLCIANEYKFLIMTESVLSISATGERNIGNVVKNVQNRMREKCKTKHRFSGTNVKKTEQVRKYFVNPETENKAFV